jgi:hypothetical protein
MSSSNLDSSGGDNKCLYSIRTRDKCHKEVPIK